MPHSPADPDRLPWPGGVAESVVDRLGNVVDLLLVAGIRHLEGHAEVAVIDSSADVVGEGEDAAGAGVAVVRAADLGHRALRRRVLPALLQEEHLAVGGAVPVGVGAVAAVLGRYLFKAHYVEDHPGRALVVPLTATEYGSSIQVGARLLQRA